MFQVKKKTQQFHYKNQNKIFKFKKTKQFHYKTKTKVSSLKTQ
jgi:hypothetical protein